jgi:drug/metabolite transporter (DMT)-like permease
VWYFIGLLAAVLLGAGFVLQQDAAQRLPQSDFLRLRLVADLLRQPRWLAGLGIMIAGQLLGALVIGHLVLALSEPLLATNLLFALIIAGRVSGQPARLRELIGAVILLAGVSALSVARAVTSVQDSVGSPAYWPYVGAAIGGIAACLAIAGRRRQGELRALLTGIAAGLVLGIQDALTRVSVRRLGSMHQVTVLLTSWPAYSLVAVGIIALWLMQSAFNSAPLHASLPGITAAEPVSGIVLGIVAFREKVPASPLLIALQVAGLIALVAGVILVAQSPVLASLRQYHGRGEHLLHPETLLHRENPIRREHSQHHEQRRNRYGHRRRRPSPDPDDPSGAAQPTPAIEGPAGDRPAGSGAAGSGAAGSPAGSEPGLTVTPATPVIPATPGQAGSELGDAPASLRRWPGTSYGHATGRTPPRPGR